MERTLRGEGGNKSVKGRVKEAVGKRERERETEMQIRIRCELGYARLAATYLMLKYTTEFSSLSLSHFK